MTETKNLTTVCVMLEDRPDGGLRVHSTELPGLILSGADKRKVTEQIAPAISALLWHQRKIVATVTAARNLHDVLGEPSPRLVDMNVHSQTLVFVVQLAKAA